MKVLSAIPKSLVLVFLLTVHYANGDDGREDVIGSTFTPIEQAGGVTIQHESESDGESANATSTQESLVQALGISSLAEDDPDNIYFNEGQSKARQALGTPAPAVASTPIGADYLFQPARYFVWTEQEPKQLHFLDLQVGDWVLPVELPRNTLYSVAYHPTLQQVYFTTARYLGRMNLNGSGMEILFDNNFEGTNRAIALDVLNGKVYWTLRTEGIMRANLDGSEVELAIPTEGYMDGGLDIDPYNQVAYWTEGTDDLVRRATTDGRYVQDIIYTGYGSRPRGLKLDLTRGKVFWTSGTDYGCDPWDDCIGRYIASANLDGSGAQVLVHKSLGTGGELNQPRGITLDTQGAYVYWADPGESCNIKRIAYTGGAIQNILCNVDAWDIEAVQ